MAAVSDVLLERAADLRRQRARPHARGVGLRDADDAVDAGRRDAEAGQRAPRGGGRRRHVGIAPVVQVQQGGLGALEQHRVAAGHLAVQDERCVGDARAQPLAEAFQFGPQPVPVDLAGPAGAAADLLVVPARFRELAGQVGRPQEVAHAETPPARLVFVGGPDAAQRRSDLPLTAHLLGHRLELPVMRKDQVGAVGDHEVVVDRDAATAQRRDLLLEGPGVDDHPVAHHAQDARVEDPGRDQVEDEALLAHQDRVAGVVAAVVTGHDLHLVGEQVHDLSLPFVAPLGAGDDDVRHERIFEVDRTGHSNRRPSSQQARGAIVDSPSGEVT